MQTISLCLVVTKDANTLIPSEKNDGMFEFYWLEKNVLIS